MHRDSFNLNDELDDLTPQASTDEKEPMDPFKMDSFKVEIEAPSPSDENPFSGMSHEEIRLAGMRQAMFSAYSHAAKSEPGGSFYDISEGSLIGGKPRQSRGRYVNFDKKAFDLMTRHKSSDRLEDLLVSEEDIKTYQPEIIPGRSVMSQHQEEELYAQKRTQTKPLQPSHYEDFSNPAQAKIEPYFRPFGIEANERKGAETWPSLEASQDEATQGGAAQDKSAQNRSAQSEILGEKRATAVLPPAAGLVTVTAAEDALNESSKQAAQEHAPHEQAPQAEAANQGADQFNEEEGLSQRLKRSRKLKLRPLASIWSDVVRYVHQARREDPSSAADKSSTKITSEEAALEEAVYEEPVSKEVVSADVTEEKTTLVEEKHEALQARNSAEPVQLLPSELLSHFKLLRQRIMLFFVVMVWVGTYFIFLLLAPQKFYSAREKRPLAQLKMPSLSSIQEGTFAKLFDQYVTDHFPLRDEWIGIYDLFNRVLLKKDNGSVFYGKGPWLFAKKNPYDNDQFYKNAFAIKDYAEWAAEDPQHVPLTFAVVPNKQEIVRQALPYAAPIREQSQWIRLLQEMTPALKTIDLTEALKQDDGQLFYYTDHHWTTRGAMLAASELLKSMGKQGLQMQDYKVETVFDQFLGTLYAKTGSFIQKADRIEIWRDQNFEQDPAAWSIIRDENGQEIKRGLYEAGALLGDSPYEVFMGGDKGFLEVETPLAQAGLDNRILIYKDSFADAMIPFLTSRYAHIYVIDPRYSELSIEDMLDHDPKIEQILILFNVNSFAEEPNFSRIFLHD